MKIEELLETSYWIIDILPEQVPANSAGQYFAVEEYFLQEPQATELRRKLANVILKLNCYYDIAVWEDLDADTESPAPDGAPASKAFTLNPAPADLAALFTGEKAVGCVRLLVLGQNTLIYSNLDDTYMTVYNAPQELADMLRLLAQSEGLFMWKK